MAEDDKKEIAILVRAMEQCPASVTITDLEGRIEYVNPKFTEVTGYGADEVQGRNAGFLKSGHASNEIYRDLWQTVGAGKAWRGEFHNRRKNGELFWERATIAPIDGPDGKVAHYLAIKDDITAEKDYEQQLLLQANFDEITGLPNRILAIDRLGQAAARAERDKKLVGLLFVDLDNFKQVNDKLGHEAGDKMLVKAARRLNDAVRRGDTVARFGGDEFLVILPDLQMPRYAERVSAKILQAMAKPFEIEGEEFLISVSIGGTIFPDDGQDPQVLLRNADAAMYRAKEAGGDSYRPFTTHMGSMAADQTTREARLRKALERGELKLYYQPLVAVASGDVVGAEALIRWHHDDMGVVGPESFIPMAEDGGLIVPIGEWALRTACKDATLWQDSNAPPVTVAVNLSSRQLKEASFTDTVAAALADTGLPAAALCLEVTERMVMEKPDQAGRTLDALRQLGVQLAIDDFGTGYSAISHLARFDF